jgi:hypothetical protein
VVQKRTHVFLPEDLLSDIDQLFGNGKRSAFLTEIVEREVRRQKRNCYARSMWPPAAGNRKTLVYASIPIFVIWTLYPIPRSVLAAPWSVTLLKNGIVKGLGYH